MTNKEALKILGNISVDYTGMTQDEINQMDEALTIAIEALEQMDDLCADHKANLAFYINERQRLMKELEESRAKEGKGALETAIESVAELITSLNDKVKVMSPEEIRALLEASDEEEEEDHEEDRDTESK